MGREIFISRLLTFILFCALAPSLPSRPSRAVNETNTVAPLSSDFYDIGTPTLTEIWVSPLGNDANSGLTIYAPLRTLTAAWNKIPATLTTSGYRVNLLPGTYPCEPGEPDNCQNYFSLLTSEDKQTLTGYLKEFVEQPFIKIKEVTPELLTKTQHSKSNYLYWINTNNLKPTTPQTEPTQLE